MQVIRRILSGDMQAKQRKCTYTYTARGTMTWKKEATIPFYQQESILWIIVVVVIVVVVFFYLEYFLVNKYAIYVKRASYTDTHNTHKRRNNTTGYIILEIWLWQVVFFSFFPLCLQNTCVCVYVLTLFGMDFVQQRSVIPRRS